MKKTTVILKVMPLVLSLPFLLTGCEELKSFFGDSSQSGGYGSSSHSSARSQTNKQAAPTTEGFETKATQHSSSKGTPASQSETAATTVSAPVSTEKKTATGTVEAPVVPSMAPTVGQ